MDFQEFRQKFEKVPVVHYPHRVPDNPLVSVLVQTFQHVNYIRQCLDGILMQQTDFDFEILLGEDASTDGTREICLEYARKYPEKVRLFLHHRENNISIGGKPTGRFNLLYNLFCCRGKYIALCEGDDYWTGSLKLQKQVEFLENDNEYSWCIHDAIITETNGSSENNRRYLGDRYKLLYETSDLLELASGGFFPTLSLVMLSKCVKNIPDFFLSHGAGDYMLVLTCSLLGKGFFFREVMGVYRIHHLGIFSSIKDDHTQRMIRDFDFIELLEAFDSYTSMKFNKTIKSVIKLKYGQIISRSLRSKNFRETLRLLSLYSGKTSYSMKARILAGMVSRLVKR